MRTGPGHRRDEPATPSSPIERPVKFQEVFATLYHNLGLDAHRDRVFDLGGRPHTWSIPDIEPMRELI